RVLGSCRGNRAPRGHHPILAAAIAIPGGGLAYPWRMQPDPDGAPRARDPSRDEAGHALLFGGSGPLGSAVLARLLAAGWRVDALSRAPREARPGLRWWRGDLGAMPALPETCDAVLSCGPLDLFAAWYAAAGPRARRVVAFGSTSATTKRTSADAGERDLAARLAGAESTLLDAAPRRGAGAVVLRPTLVYGGQAPLALERIAEMARRRGVFVLPRGATGLRQPVHVDDLAGAAMAALAAPEAATGRGYDLPGGEALPYREMVARVLAAQAPEARLLEVPGPAFALLAGLLRSAGRLPGFGRAAQARLREDLAFDPAPAAEALGYAPRPFRPGAPGA